MSYVEKGDLFRDKDKRTQGRIVRVVERGGFPYSFLVENVEHWNEELIGRRTLVQLETLHNRFEKVSH